jgi:hypothetical protein
MEVIATPVSALILSTASAAAAREDSISLPLRST